MIMTMRGIKHTI